jgi:photosystem II cytochrome c550
MDKQIFFRRTMLKRFIWVVVASIFFAFQLHINSAFAIELDENARTVKFNEQGQEKILSIKQIEKGQKIFYDTCSQCHVNGRTKTNPNVSLSLRDLGGAEPSRDNVLAMVDYLKNPTTYDGENEITELHLNTKRVDLYPEMRNYTDDDLESVSGYILVQARLRGSKWGGGKVYD